MPIVDLYNGTCDIYTHAISSRTTTGGIVRTSSLKYSGISCYFTYLSGREQIEYGKRGVIADYRLFCDPDYDITSTDWVYYNNNWYEVSYIDVCSNSEMSHHIELLLVGILSPQSIMASSSSSSSESEDNFSTSSSNSTSSSASTSSSTSDTSTSSRSSSSDSGESSITSELSSSES